MRYFIFLSIVSILFLASCSTNTSEASETESSIKSSANIEKAETKEDSSPLSGTCSNGVKYEIFTDNKGKKPKIKDYLTLNLSYSTIVPKDSLIFSSFDREKPVQMRFTKSLFGGALNEGLLMMTEGDSAKFLIPAQLLYRRLPTFAKRGDNIMYNVKLIEVIDNPIQGKP